MRTRRRGVHSWTPPATAIFSCCYAARDRDRNNAVVLKDYLLTKLSRTGTDEGDIDSSG
jgi:hypothetical protein